MKMVSDIIDFQDLQKRIAQEKASHVLARQHGISPNFRELALLEYANGLPAEQFREMLREGIPASEVAITKSDQDAEFKGLSLCETLIGWEFDAAERMAAACKPGQPAKGSAYHARGNALGLWRAAILGRTQEAIAFLDAMPEPRHGNPPERRELAEGVITGDAKLMRAGLKATSDRFKKAWTLKTWCTPSRLKYYGTAARMTSDVCKHLIAHNWLLSNWAVGWMSLAWHRGLTGAFGEPKFFSPWVPWELCCPEPNPGSAAPRSAVSVRTKKPGKRELRAELFAAVACGNVKAIQSLIARGVQLDTLNQDRQTPLMVAVHSSYRPVVVALIQAGTDVTLLDPKGRTALGIAADLGMVEMTRTILSCGIKPDLTDKPVTPLVRASRGGHLEIVHLLLKAGADPNRISAYGNSSALTDAIKKNHIEVVHTLVEAGASVNTPVEDDGTAIQCAISTGNVDLIRFLLKSGADVNALNYWGCNALHVAADHGSAEILALIIKAGAGINVALKQERLTPLMMAVPHPECVKLLLDAGADVAVRNKKKQTVFDLAQGYPESLSLLRAHGPELGDNH